MRRIAFEALTIAFTAVASYPALAQDKPNCDPQLGLTDGSCYARPDPPWWTCRDDRYSEQDVNPDQQKQIMALALTLFIPRSQGQGETSLYFPRRELIRRFGKPIRSTSVEVNANPQDPTDNTIWERTRWEFPGVRITTRAEEPGTDSLLIEEGEIYGANAHIRGDLRIGQSVKRWVSRFGRPGCRTDGPARDHVTYDASYFTCDETQPCVGGPYDIELYLDAAGRVERVKWRFVSGH